MTQLPKSYSHPITKEISYDLVLIPPGEYLMGSEDAEAYEDEQPVHQVRITQGFYMGKYPVTQAVWSAVMGGHNPSYFKGPQRPVESVSLQDIIKGGQDEDLPISFLSMLERSYPINHQNLKNWHFRLPTEAEWEYAARANSHFKFSGGDKLNQIGWSNQSSQKETKRVGLKTKNFFELYDMSGNVSEWCIDKLWDMDLENLFYIQCHKKGLVEDPICKRGVERILRGGSWGSYQENCRVYSRTSANPLVRSRYHGFRLVLAPISKM